MANKKKIGNPLPKIKKSYIEPIPSEVEVAELVALWDQYSPSQFRGLLVAKNKSAIEETNAKPGAFIWDDKLKKFLHVASGRYLSRDDLHSALSRFVENYSQR